MATNLLTLQQSGRVGVLDKHASRCDMPCLPENRGELPRAR